MIFYQKKQPLPITIITGCCRTGKTTIAKAIAQRNNAIDFLEEPWLPMVLPAIIDDWKMPEDRFVGLMRAYFDELVNDIVLYRRANFRPNDTSSISSFKTQQHIMERLTTVNTRSEVREFIKNPSYQILITLPEVGPLIEFFLKIQPSIKIIHVVRDQKAVAQLVEEKKWYSEESLLEPSNNQPFQELEFFGKIYYMPWWLPKENFERFLKASDYEKGLIYHKTHVDLTREKINSLGSDQKKLIIEIDSDQYFKNPPAIQEKIEKFLIFGNETQS